MPAWDKHGLQNNNHFLVLPCRELKEKILRIQTYNWRIKGIEIIHFPFYGLVKLIQLARINQSKCRWLGNF